MSPILYAFLFMLGCILVPILFMAALGGIYLLFGKNPEDSWWYKLLNPKNVSPEVKEQAERDRARISEIDRKNREAEDRRKELEYKNRVDRASCLTCTNRRHCDKTHCVGYSGDPSIK